MSKLSKEIASVLKETEIIDTLVNDDAKNWFEDIKTEYDKYSIEYPTIFDTSDIEDLKLTVVVEKRECARRNSELYAGDLLDNNTETVIDASFIMSQHLYKDYPDIEIYAYDEDDENDNEVIILVTV